MITCFHFLRLAVNNLRRGGQRIFVALLCITFGTTALVSMTMIAKSIESSVNVPPALLVGGDLSMGRKTEKTVYPEHVAELDALVQRGVISGYTLIAYNSSSIMFRAAESSEMHFAGIGLGIEPASYPLAGSLTIGEPGSIGLPSLLQQPGDVIITRDLALTYHLSVGDAIVLSDLRMGVPMEGMIRGIAYDTPNHMGDKVYYTIETAQALAGEQAVFNTVIANTTRRARLSRRWKTAGGRSIGSHPGGRTPPEMSG
jgi:putative ABC transport system permease protein